MKPDNQDMEKGTPAMDFTGERFTPECEREIWYEHYHRYAFASPLVAGKKVLDAACGEGYGAAVLAKAAAEVVGLDLDEQAVRHAQTRYATHPSAAGRLSFCQGSCAQLPFADNSFDAVVSFETLEHLEQQEQMLSEFNRVLKDDGFLIISTPDKAIYSDATGYDNPWHVRELYRPEFASLLDRHWPAQRWLGQKMAFFSVLWDEQKPLHTVSTLLLDEEKKLLSNRLTWPPVYHVVIAARDKQHWPSVADMNLFADVPESVYGHYHAVIRAHIQAEKELKAIKQQLQRWKTIPLLGRWLKYLEEKHGI
jgi:SAM-dependent methyltransferase